MGTLRKYEMKTSLCKVFFETGTGLGHSLQHALDNGNFDNLYSTEIYKETANRAIIKFKKYKYVQILNTNSITALAATLPTIPPDVPILFFLDAHFPGEVEQGYDYATNDPSSLNLPLEEELCLIKKLRSNSQDVIVVDDLKIYENGRYENGNIGDNFANIEQTWRNLDFLNNLFFNKSIERLYLDDGYLIIKPHDSKFTLNKVSTLYRTKRTIKKNITRFINWARG